MTEKQIEDTQKAGIINDKEAAQLLKIKTTITLFRVLIKESDKTSTMQSQMRRAMCWKEIAKCVLDSSF